MLRIGCLILVVLWVWACSIVPVTGRKQLNLFPEDQMIAMSLQAYDDFLAENAPVPVSSTRAQQVQTVGKRMAMAVGKHLEDSGMGDRVKGFNWEFNLVDDPAVNAWAMPGGKVVIYTGILPYTQNETGLAVVMGHEIAHAIARHGNERMSQAVAQQGLGMTLDVLTAEKSDLTRALLLQSYGIGSQLGMLAYSRKHETEADEMGLIFMAIAGYDPREAPAFWRRMEQGQGGSPQEFLSTHPSHETRAKNLKAFMPRALEYYDRD